MNKIQILVPDEAIKIAAGEVIDRPASLVREFMDNAIDSGAVNIDVSIDRGGIACTEVSDDGCGMDREDIALCCLTHATSKIRGLADLDRLSTLGFRGEALAAAAAVARLEIVSSPDGLKAWRLLTGPSDGAICPEAYTPEPARRTRGSSVRAKNLFDTIPARKRFLKREGSEGGLCMQTFIDKALPFPNINFRFLRDGELKLFLPAVNGDNAPFKKRFAAAVLSGSDEHFLHEIAASGKDFSVKIVVGGPELYRTDRRKQYIFANGRRINDFSLLQTIEYGSQGCFPNGVHPVGAIFLEVDPSKADFNIHPAKREARFADSSTIHHEITTALRSFFRHISLNRQQTETGRETFLFERSGQGGGNFPPRRDPQSGGGRDDGAALDRILSGEYGFAPLPGRGKESGLLSAEDSAERSPAAATETAAAKLRYVGRVFGLFILVEDSERLYIIDQHAAHERILYDRFMAEPIARQDLLVPITFLTDSAADDEFLSSHRQELAKLGVVIEGGQGSWRIEALPALWRLGDGETINAILGLRTAGENIAERWAATLVCHSAVRDGDYLDDEAALALAETALALPIQR
ncbi:MAG: DNA mismatch repair endonuclease MutL, partial [Spirochaetaceae bacterium]|nr:DNA mismatch repair endonuclease MutL [Spirochaetaceae bacterium]